MSINTSTKKNFYPLPSKHQRIFIRISYFSENMIPYQRYIWHIVQSSCLHNRNSFSANLFLSLDQIINSSFLLILSNLFISRGLLLSALLIIPLYLFLAFIAVSTVTTEEVLQVPLLSFAAGRIFGSYGSIIFSIAGMTACLSALGTSLSVQSSISRGMSRDGYFPKILLSVHSRFGTYHVAAIVGIVFIMFLSTLGAIPFLGYAASFGSLLVFAVVNLSLIRLRKKKPYMNRPFKTPLYPVIPVLGLVLSVALLFVPIVIGDGNAIDALTSSIGLIGIVFVSYYLRMAGRYRAQIGLGGIGIGVGVSLAFFSLLRIAGLAVNILPFVPSYVQLVFSIVFLLTGYFNLTAGERKTAKNG